MNYQDFLEQKKINSESYGFDIDLSHLEWFMYELFDYQNAIVRWALRRGRAAIFADTGLGKTAMQLAWADQVRTHIKVPVIILAPLAVAHQTVKEGEKFGIESKYASCQDDISGPGIYVTNYEKLHKFDCSVFGGVVLDESSILKGMNGKVRKQVTEAFSKTPYRLSCTATPSPNDHMELGTQAEFLGIMSQLEMLAQYFVHDGSDTSKWRLKGHGVKRFWEWVSTWAVVIRKPSDLGFQDDGHELPELILHQHTVECAASDELFVTPAQSLSERISARRNSLHDRVQLAAKIAGEYSDQSLLVWCNLNDESDALSSAIDGAVNVSGSDKAEHKEKSMLGFAEGAVRVMVTKPKIAGFGMNWQICNRMIFVGLSDSWEQYYQAIRRCWRYGQTKPVHVHIVSAETEGAVVENIRRKDIQHDEMADQMVGFMREFMQREVLQSTTQKTEYQPAQPIQLPTFLRAA